MIRRSQVRPLRWSFFSFFFYGIKRYVLANFTQAYMCRLVLRMLSHFSEILEPIYVYSACQKTSTHCRLYRAEAAEAPAPRSAAAQVQLDSEDVFITHQTLLPTTRIGSFSSLVYSILTSPVSRFCHCKGCSISTDRTSARFFAKRGSALRTTRSLHYLSLLTFFAYP